MGIYLRIFDRLLSIGGIAGLIALGIAASICVRYVQHGAEEIPQVLSYSLTTIIGFYFGTGVARPSTANASVAPTC